MVQSKTPYSDATKCRKKTSTNRIKRPMNPFMVFAQQERRKITSSDPERHNADISKELGRKWRSLSILDKKPYVELARSLHRLHQIEFPNYKYKPRKKRES
ncbi:hypothetical protein HELRODRAFT_78096, partial [Helobdella robusta]|uniref:Transcription factor SOX-30 n=1 Tax=Helobdella robusta TaxID=6412 RepID=T1G376_HELRO